MPRNKAFYPQREPHSNRPHLHLHHEHVHGPFASFNPTTARYSAHSASLERLIDKNQDEKKVPSQSSSDDAYNAAEDPNSQSTLPTNTAQDNTISNSTTPAHDISFEWRSRDNRKGRTLLLVDTDASSNSKTPYLVPRSSKSAQEIFKVVKIMATQCWYWDVSYLVATIFTLGSVIWVINAFFVYLPLAQPSTEFKNEIAYGGGITAFLGATVFEIGSVLLMFEAVNANQSGCFGWAMEKLVDEHFRPHENGEKIRIIPNGDISDHHMNKNSIGGRHIVTDGTKDGKSWRWFPTTLELKTHYMYELGFLASFAQLFGATVFWISGFTALPGIQDKMSQGLLDGIYWVPQIVGGTGFIVSGTLFMLETQQRWYIPALDTLGWHIGFWNLIGAFGFTLCGALGPAYANSGAQYEASLATFWGSWAFLIGSVVQWFESMNKHPVQEMKKGDAEKVEGKKVSGGEV